MRKTLALSLALALALAAAPAHADILLENIPCESIEGSFTTVANTQILVNSPGQIEFSIPSATAYAPPADISGIFFIDVPVTITSQIPSYATYNFELITGALPSWLLAFGGTTTATATTGANSVSLSRRFFPIGAIEDGASVALEVKGTVSGIAQFPVANVNSSITSFPDPPSIPRGRSIRFNTYSNDYLLEINPGAFTYPFGALESIPQRWAIRTELLSGGSVFTDYRIVVDPNPWFQLEFGRDGMNPNFSNGDSSTIFSVFPDAPYAENAVVGAEIQMRVSSCS